MKTNTKTNTDIEINLITEHYKKIFLKYFSLSKYQLNFIFSSEKLLVAPIWLQLKSYLDYPNHLYLNYLTILEFIGLSLTHHQEILPNENNDMKIESLNMKKILLGDLLIVLAIQEINQFDALTSNIFYQTIKDVFNTKIKNNLSPETPDDKNNQNSQNIKSVDFLKFILFFKFYLKADLSQDVSDEINEFYEELSSYARNKSSSNFESITRWNFKTTQFPIKLLTSYFKETFQQKKTSLILNIV